MPNIKFQMCGTRKSEHIRNENMSEIDLFFVTGNLHCENAIATHETVDKKQQALGGFSNSCLCEAGKLQSRPMVVEARSLAIIKGYNFTVSRRLLEKVILYLKKATSSI